MKFSEELDWRGCVKDKTFDNLSWLDTPRTFYLGVDCSADSLTIGNLAIFMLARRLNQAGWKTILLVGGATSLIGDPGGKTEERTLKPRAEVEANVAAIKKQVQRLFSGADFTLVDNYDWFKDMKYLEFLRDVGKHFSMSELLNREFITERLGEDAGGISYAEFSYTLIQGYDFWHLFKEHGAQLQIGGSDQWGNMLSGVGLIRKKEGPEAQALSMPLIINKTTGKKFGKSEEGAVWLDPDKTTPTQFYQFWINADDEGVEEYLKVYTALSKDEIEQIMAEHHQNPGVRTAQTLLAQAVTALVHGDDEMALAEAVTDFLTAKTPIGEADERALAAIRTELRAAKAPADGSIAEALLASGLAASNSEARRLLSEQAVYINNNRAAREQFEANDFQNGRLLLRRGKKFKDAALIELA